MQKEVEIDWQQVEQLVDDTPPDALANALSENLPNNLGLLLSLGFDERATTQVQHAAYEAFTVEAKNFLVEIIEKYQARIRVELGEFFSREEVNNLINEDWQFDHSHQSELAVRMVYLLALYNLLEEESEFDQISIFLAPYQLAFIRAVQESLK